MKVFIFCVLIAVSQAVVIAPALFNTGSSSQYKTQDAVVISPALFNTGSSSQYKTQDNIGNYNFGYSEGHLSGATFRKEAGDAFGNKIGSYGLTDADGRSRVVNYVADATGFRANIQTNEPGVEPKDPASASIKKAITVAPTPVFPYSVPVPVMSYAAPAPLVSYSSPVAAKGTTVHYTAPAPITYSLAASPFSLKYPYGLPLFNHGITGTRII